MINAIVESMVCNVTSTYLISKKVGDIENWLTESKKKMKKYNEKYQMSSGTVVTTALKLL